MRNDRFFFVPMGVSSPSMCPFGKEDEFRIFVHTTNFFDDLCTTIPPALALSAGNVDNVVRTTVEETTQVSSPRVS